MYKLQIIIFYSILLAGSLWDRVSNAQISDQFRSDWYNEEMEWFTFVTIKDGIYEIDIQELINKGFPDDTVPEEEMKLFVKGREIPIQIVKNNPGNLTTGDKIRFYGERQKGKDELWAYGGKKEFQSSNYFSLFTDSNYYWLTWSPANSLRYTDLTGPISGTFFDGFRDTVHVEADIDDSRRNYIGYESQAEISFYTESEGMYMFDLDLTGRQSQDVTFTADIHDIVLVDSTVNITARLSSQSNGSRTGRIDLFHNKNGSIAYHTLNEVSWSGKGGRVVSASVSPVRLVNYENMDIRFRYINNNQGSSINNTHLVLFDWYEVSYFRGFNLKNNESQFHFSLRPDGLKTVRLENIGREIEIHIYEPKTGAYFESVTDTNKQASFYDSRASGSPLKYVMVKSNNFLSVTSMRKYEQKENLISTNHEGEFLIITRDIFSDVAWEYAEYRSSKSQISTKVIDAEDIWNQFGYGSPRPIALQRFLKYAFYNWKTPPKYVFIIADARIQNRYTDIKSWEIPGFGYPVSDSWFTMNFTGYGDWFQRISIGRLTARTPSEVTAYLSKVVQYEINPIEYGRWQKRVTLLSGGFDNVERQTLLNHNLQYGQIANQSLIGADTVIVAKRSNQPLDESSRQDLSNIINSGTFILHFFGHSSPESWDLLTDNPDAFQNEGRSTIVLSLGCYSGLYTTQSSRVISEEFVFAPNAAVAFVGGSGQGQVSSLSAYARFFYESMFSGDYKLLGDVEKEARLNLARRNPSSISDYDLALILNTNIFGDPSVRLALPTQPDYRFDYNPLTIDPDPTNISDSTFTVNIRVRNLGIKPQSNVDVTFTQLRPELGTRTFSEVLSPVATTSILKFPVDIKPEDAGEHQFNFTIDQTNSLAEYDEFNNSYSAAHVIFSTSVDVILPENGGVYNKRNPEFIVSTPTAFDGENIIIELHDNEDYNLILADTVITSNVINIRWKPNIQLDSGREYFWRARVDRPDEVNWNNAYFLVDTTSTGNWWQQQNRSFITNTFSNNLGWDGQIFTFDRVNLQIRTSTINWALANQPNYYNYPASTFVNGEQMGRLAISFFMLVINGTTGAVLNGVDSQGIPRGQHYDVHPGIFTNTDARTKTQFINDLNAITPGNYVVLRVRNFRLISPITPLFSGSNDPLLEALRKVGAFKAVGGLDGNSTPQLTTPDGYILFGKKFAKQDDYNPEEVSEYIERNGILEADTTYSFFTSEGDMTSPVIGPVKAWKEVYANSDLIDQTGKLVIDVYGITQRNGIPKRIRALNPSGINDIVSALIDDIDAKQYPYLQLKARFSNPSRKTPQLKEWRVKFEPLPELALDPFSASVETDTIEVGYPYEFNIRVRNIGLIDVDTVVVNYENLFFDNSGNLQSLSIKKDTIRNIEWFDKPIQRAPVTSRKSSVSIPTTGKLGRHQIIARFDDSFVDQLRYNNIYIQSFQVREDTTQPRIEVFIDNRFIAPVEKPIIDKFDPTLSYVSTKPTFDIYWRDNNKYLRIQDTNSFEIRLFSENPNAYQRYTYTDPEVFFTPAKNNPLGQRNEAYVRFQPDFTHVKDTVFTLQVLSSDFSGNVAEHQKNGYLISFRVTNNSGITSFYPYPNPMSSFTNFAFELQGGNISAIDRLKLKIFTLSGKPIKIIDILKNQHLLNDGQLRIGWNIFRWDGRDEDGDKLATGVYLYKVDFKADGKILPVNNDTSIEKLVIIK